MLTIDKLKEYGANVNEGLERCMNNTDFYLRLVKMLLADDSFNALRQAINDNDLKAGFEAAHSLKGTSANLAITPLNKAVVEITELLRNREDVDYAPYLEKIFEEKEKLEKLIN